MRGPCVSLRGDAVVITVGVELDRATPSRLCTSPAEAVAPHDATATRYLSNAPWRPAPTPRLSCIRPRCGRLVAVSGPEDNESRQQLARIGSLIAGY